MGMSHKKRQRCHPRVLRAPNFLFGGLQIQEKGGTPLHHRPPNTIEAPRVCKFLKSNKPKGLDPSKTMKPYPPKESIQNTKSQWLTGTITQNDRCQMQVEVATAP
jgi:hypothetical protein